MGACRCSLRWWRSDESQSDGERARSATESPHGRNPDMKRFQLTIVFVLFSAMTIGAGAVAVNSLTASSAERSLLSLTESQSERDARFIATLVGQLLAADAPGEAVSPPLQGAPTELLPSPAFNATTLLINAPTVLKALDITDLAIYGTSGSRIWSSTLQGPMAARLTDDSLARALSGETVSGILDDAALLPGNPGEPADLVVTFVPLIGETSGKPVQVLGVSRPVPPGVAGLLSESRNTVMKTTLISLSGVFLILLAFVLAADLRIWKRNERALAVEREQQEVLGRRNLELNELNESRTRFISAISHELSNPLASLVSFLELVLRNRTGNLTERQIEQLSTARRNGRQMNRLVKDLSDAARTNVDSLEIVYDEFPVRPMLDEVAESLSPDLNTRQQVLKVEANRELGSMEGDRGRLIQVFSNLVSNASKYSPNGSTIRLAAEIAHESLHVEVVDEGIGISEEDQEHIFEMFWRAENPDVQGAGIGLVLARQIVAGHGGQISVNSIPKEGTTVMFEVPLRPAGTGESASDANRITSGADDGVADGTDSGATGQEALWGQAA